MIEDLRHSLRTLRRSPGFAIAAILVLAIGIGLNLTFFQLVNIAYLKPLPIKDPDTLVRISVPRDFSRLDFAGTELLASNKDAFSATLLLSDFSGHSLVWERNAGERLVTNFVSANWFEELGETALQGRLFTASDGNANAEPVVVISERFWETRLDRNPSTVGSIVRLNGRPFRIVGIEPQGHGFLPGTQVWIPFNQARYVFPDSNGKPLSAGIYARIRPGLSIALAEARLRPTLQELVRQQRRFSADSSVGLFPASNQFRDTRSTRGMFYQIKLYGSFTFLILIVTCSNLANLILSRAAGRIPELSVRAGLGASRWRIVRHLFAETVVLSSAASVLALLLSYWVIRAVSGWNSFFGFVLLEKDLSIDWRTLLFALGATALVTLLAGLLPAWTIGKRDLMQAMRDGGYQTSASVGRALHRKVFLGLQIAGSCLLLVFAGLTLRTLKDVLVPPGFDYEAVVVAFGVDAKTEQERDAIWRNAKEQILQMPGVQNVSLVSSPPFVTGSVKHLDSRPAVKFTTQQVEAEFFELARLRFLNGRPFESSDAGTNPVVVSKSLATQLYGSGNPIGQPLPEYGTIVGVVNDVRNPFDETDWPEVYQPAVKGLANVFVRARTEPEAAKLMPLISQALRGNGTHEPEVHLWKRHIQPGIDAARNLSWLVSGLAALALSVACVGIFGVVSYNVALRQRELSIRLALGASRRSVIVLFVSQLVWPIALSILGGLAAAAFIAERYSRSFQTNIAVVDTPVMTAATLVILIAVAVASIVPTLRALAGPRLKLS